MSEIQVVIPLSVLKGVKDLTPEGISDFLSNLTTENNQVQVEKAKNKAYRDMISLMSQRLTFILEGAPNEYMKAQELRSLEADLKEQVKGFAVHGN